MSDLNESFPSFNGMNRPAMVLGVPMVAALFILSFMVATGFLGAFLNWGFYSLILPALGAIYLLFLKIICEDDPNALAFIKWRLKAILIKQTQGNPVILLTSDSHKREVYNARRQFKKW
ncbi:hypothetical protein BKG96_07550 [Rodentibacter caecimuris]|uniref:Conjugal transfer protein TraD n=1 Tax=Rodentibacter caecimuris TaxID=1796644 RepID=A0A1V3KKJ0_9PAST|nr:VirB3 family type IV secretion system protein [Rodentibacter heylii]OOF77868.1 hypothetical protein BKG96_07550 [Rodentibacter heylii]